MGSIHNTRILRFLIVLGAVILTIFIYASYSTNTSLAPPHQRRSPAADSQPAVAAALNGQQSSSTANRSTGDGALLLDSAAKFNANGSANSIKSHSSKGNKKSSASPSASLIFAKKQHYREPTIDEDAGNGNSLDDVPDEAALERFVNNDLLDEQYGQNMENTMGNINNSSASAGGSLSQQLSVQQQQQQQQQNQLVDNNLNKILDSEVLIPTSNLQKFIENADKILKNITAISPVPANKPAEVDSPPPAPKVKEPQQSPQQPSGANNNNNIADEDEALPPSVVMTIKRGSADTAESVGAVVTKSNANVSKKAKIVAKSNSPTLKAAIDPKPPFDPTQGIPAQQIYESGHMNEELDIAKLCPNEGADLKLLVLITSALSHAEARLTIRQTWAHYGIRRDVSTAFILGRTTNETVNVALTQENFIYGDLIRGHFIDSYNNLTLKTISALEWVDQHCSLAKYVLKTDDDMFINVPKLLAFLDSHAKEKRVIYGRLAKKWKPIRNKKSKYFVSTGQFGAPVFPPFTTGPAYVLTGDIIHELYVRSLHQVYLKLEDVFTTGIVAQQLNIKRVHVNEFLNRRIAFNPCNIRKTISVHMIKANEQFDLWKKLLDQTTKCK